MVWDWPLADLKSYLRVLGEVPKFEEKGGGHLRHCCKQFKAFVNFWESTGHSNVQGKEQEKLEELLEARVRQHGLPAVAVSSVQGPNASGGAVQIDGPQTDGLHCSSLRVAESQTPQAGHVLKGSQAPSSSGGGVQIALPRTDALPKSSLGGVALLNPSAGHGLKDSMPMSAKSSEACASGAALVVDAAPTQDARLGSASSMGPPRLREQEAQSASVAAEGGEQHELRQELCKVKELLRIATKRADAAEKERDQQRERADSAETALKKAEKSMSAARAEKRPVVQSGRGELVSKRACIEHCPILSRYSGDLCTKINEARADGEISPATADKMHQRRMEGNDAAHAPPGCFGTQVGPGEQDPLADTDDSDCDSDNLDNVGWEFPD